MKNLFAILALVVSSITLFSCTTDDNDLAQDINTVEISPEEIAGYEEGHVEAGDEE